MTTWKELLDNALHQCDSIESLELSPSDIDLDREFSDGLGGSEGVPFLAWSKNWVYFTHVYDGAECIYSVPRNVLPNGPRVHVGYLDDEDHKRWYLKDQEYIDMEARACSGDEEALEWLTSEDWLDYTKGD